MLVLWLGIRRSLPAYLIQPYPLPKHTYFLTTFSGPLIPKDPFKFGELFDRLRILISGKLIWSSAVGRFDRKGERVEYDLRFIYGSRTR